MSITVENVSRHFGAFRALDGVSLSVPAGELVALLGPSGSGKTTLLRIIAGLEQPDAGRILFHDADVAVTPVGERGVGFVFQHYALFPHMSIFENVAFGLRVRPRRARPGDEYITRKVMELLELVHLDGMARRFPAQLSGGQRQRVALARALAIEPRVLLLDEPFGALDAKVRAELRGWLRRLHDELHVTSVFVTHDQEEALEVADRVVVMNGGRIEQVGTPDDVFHRPATEFVLSFIGQVNRFQGWVGAGCIEIDDISFPLPGAEASDAPASIFIRPHEMRIEPAAHRGIGATVRYINTAGPLARLELDTDRNGRLLVDLPLNSVGELELKRGMRVHVAPENVRYFPQRA